MPDQFNDPMAPIGVAATNNQVSAAPAPAMAPLTPAIGAESMAPIAGAPAAGNASPGFFQQGGGAQVALGAVQTLGSLWNSFQQQKMAKKTFALNEEAYRSNLADQRKTHNSGLEDRIRSRYAYEGKSNAQADKTIADRSL
jgi:hypothetical protein